MIITIDGPAGAGKSTAARALAQRLGCEFLDTGATYRAVTLAVLRACIDPQDEAALGALLAQLKLEMPPGRVVLDGADVTGLLRSKEVSAAASALAENGLVRGRLVELQRRIAAGRDMVCEGRDQGTVAFPDAACKFFLKADPQERARRRWQEMQQRGEAGSLEDVLRDQDARDRRDAARALAPMVPAADAIILDSTRMTLDEVVTRMEREVRRRQQRPNDS